MFAFFHSLPLFPTVETTWCILGWGGGREGSWNSDRIYGMKYGYNTGPPYSLPPSHPRNEDLQD